MTAEFNHQKNIQYLITVISANDLPGVDNHGTSSDPYVIIKFGSNVAQTHYVKKSLQPVWNQAFRFNSSTPISLAKFTIWDHNTIKHDIPLGEGEFNLDNMGTGTTWEGSIPIVGHQIKVNNVFLKVQVERKNFTTIRKKMSKSFGRLEDKAKEMMVAKCSNIARLAYITAYNHMSARKLEGSIDVQVQLAWFMVQLSTEVSTKESESTGTIEVVEDTDHNIGVTQTKPTKGMRRNLEGRITDVLNNIETTSTKLSSNVAVTVKAGLVIGFLISPIPKIEIEVQVLFGVQVKAGVGVSNFIVRPGAITKNSRQAPPIEPPLTSAENTEEDEALKEMICKLATEDEVLPSVPQSPAGEM